MTCPIHARRRWDRMCVVRRLFDVFSRRRGSNSKRRGLHHEQTGDTSVSVGPVDVEVGSARVVAPQPLRSSATRAEVLHPPTPRGDALMTHEPCSMCGMAESPPWRGPSKHQSGRLICGRCGEWLHGPHSVDARDLAAAVLAGIATDSHRIVPRRLGALSGLVFFCESGRTEANVTPWEHVDLEAHRRRVLTLAEARHFRLPPRWTPTVRVVW